MIVPALKLFRFGRRENMAIVNQMSTKRKTNNSTLRKLAFHPDAESHEFDDILTLNLAIRNGEDHCCDKCTILNIQFQCEMRLLYDVALHESDRDFDNIYEGLRSDLLDTNETCYLFVAFSEIVKAHGDIESVFLWRFWHMELLSGHHVPHLTPVRRLRLLVLEGSHLGFYEIPIHCREPTEMALVASGLLFDFVRLSDSLEGLLRP